MPKITETFATRAARLAVTPDPTPEQRDELAKVTAALAAEERLAAIESELAALTDEKTRLTEVVAAAKPTRGRR